MCLGRIRTEWQRGGSSVRHVTHEDSIMEAIRTGRSRAAASDQGNTMTCDPKVSDNDSRVRSLFGELS
jgi:hypothetical protein